MKIKCCDCKIYFPKTKLRLFQVGGILCRTCAVLNNGLIWREGKK